MESNTSFSKMLILRLLNGQRVVIQSADSKICFNKDWLNSASNSSIYHSSEFSTDAPKDATLEFCF